MKNEKKILKKEKSQEDSNKEIRKIENKRDEVLSSESKFVERDLSQIRDYWKDDPIMTKFIDDAIEESKRVQKKTINETEKEIDKVKTNKNKKRGV